MVRIASTIDEKNRSSQVGAYHIDEIRFDDLIDIYFYDIDFLMDSDTIMKLGIERRKGLGIHDETFGISQGLPPHPEELEIKKHIHEDQDVSIQPTYWEPGSRVYPDMD
jgi:hypothetical protein